jgi:hypothetical protein
MKTNSKKSIAIGYTPSEVNQTQYTTIKEIKDAYVRGDIDIQILERKLEKLIE